MLKQLEDIAQNLFNFTNLVKSVVSYKIKQSQFEEAIFSTIEKRLDEFTIAQLETLIWAVSKR